MGVVQIVPSLNETLGSTHSSMGRKEGRRGEGRGRREAGRQTDMHTQTETNRERFLNRGGTSPCLNVNKPLDRRLITITF